MGLLGLPNELLLNIGETLDSHHSINAFTQVNRRLYTLLNHHLYRFHLQNTEGYALLWAARHGHEAVARKLIKLGVDVNVSINCTMRFARDELYELDICIKDSPLLLASMYGMPVWSRSCWKRITSMSISAPRSLATRSGLLWLGVMSALSGCWSRGRILSSTLPLVTLSNHCSVQSLIGVRLRLRKYYSVRAWISMLMSETKMSALP